MDVSFRLVAPEQTRTSGWFQLERAHGSARLLELPGVPFDVVNSEVDGDRRQVAALEELCRIPRMSTLALGRTLDTAVRSMPPHQVFVNVGVWNGFTFLSSVVNNSTKSCIGVDNFSQFHGPRDAFMERFERHASKSHSFHDMDYQEYFERVHSEPIGVYLYDGDHSYDNQRRGLEVAERFLADGCLVLVDDTNWDEPRQGTLDFIAASNDRYEPLFDVATALNGHPTFWNGAMAFRLSKNSAGGEAPAFPRVAQIEEVELGDQRANPFAGYRGNEHSGGTPRVSLIVDAGSGDPSLVEATIESALAQTWPALDVLLACNGQEAPAELDERVIVVPDVADAVNRSIGHYIAFAYAGAELDAADVHLALGYPLHSQFYQGPIPAGQRATLEALLAVGETVAAMVPPGSAIGVDRRHLPSTFMRRRQFPLVDESDGKPVPSDDAEAVRRFEDIYAQRPSHFVLTWENFDWLGRYPGFAERLTAEAQLLTQDNWVAVYELRPRT